MFCFGSISEDNAGMESRKNTSLSAMFRDTMSSETEQSEIKKVNCLSVDVPFGVGVPCIYPHARRPLPQGIQPLVVASLVI